MGKERELQQCPPIPGHRKLKNQMNVSHYDKVCLGILQISSTSSSWSV